MARIHKSFFILIILILSCSFCFSQISDTQKTLRIRLWAPLDENPASQISPETENAFGTSFRSLKATAPYLLSGMIYGWKFEYTPSDNTRNVEEYFSLEPISEIPEDDEKIIFTNPAFLDTRVYCWLEYLRTDEMMISRQRWDSIQFPRVSGTGESLYLDSVDSIDGIKEAVKNAAKNAIRIYAQKQTKNKPKEVTGTILLKDIDPNIKIIKGKYTAHLDFFLYVDKIIQYSQF
jgi:hypothetical protein